MKKHYKIGLIALGTIIAAFASLVIILTLVLDAEDYKKEIIAQVKKHSGRDLAIRGDIGLSVFPWIGVEIGELKLSNAPGFGSKPFAHLDKAGVKIKLLPLLAMKVQADTIYLDGLRLDLQVKRNGTSNWDDLGASNGKATPKRDTPKSTAAESGATLAMLSVGDLNIRDASISYSNQQDGSRYQVKQLNLKSSQFANHETADFFFKAIIESTAPKLSLPLQITAGITPDWDKQSLEISALKLTLDKTRAKGSVSVKNFSAPDIRFDLKIDELDTDRLFAVPASGGGTSSVRSTATGSGGGSGTAGQWQAQGKLAIDKLILSGARIEQIQLTLVAKNDIITIDPLAAQLYQGKLQGKLILNNRGARPRVNMKTTLNGVDIGPLLQDADITKKFGGNGDVNLNLSFAGSETNQILRSLNGSAGLTLRDGKIQGINLLKQYRQYQEAKKLREGKIEAAQLQSGDESIYQILSASFQIANGVAHNKDLSLKAARYQATGAGWLDLANDKLKYDWLIATISASGVTGDQVPIRCEGKLSGPSCKPRIDEMLKQEGKKQLLESIEKKLREKGLEGLLGR